MEKSFDEGELLLEYNFDYAKAKPNRFTPGKPLRTVAVLDEDLSRVFTTPESVNKALRALLEAVPKPDKDAA